MKNIYLMVFCFVVGAGSSFAAQSNFDLAGKWNLAVSNSEDKDCIGTNELTFVATPFKSEKGQTLYLVDGSLCNEKLWGASVEKFGDQQHVVWYMLKGQRFDGESNMILESSPTVITLGGDFETYEVAKMTKTAQLEE